MESQLSTYKQLIASARNQVGTNDPLNAAIESFEPQFFNHMVLVLDNYFVHRARGLKKKDGNSLNEVKMLCNSIINNQNKLSADKTIKYDAAKSVLKYKIGDQIKLNEADFLLMYTAFFVEIEKKYSV